MKSSCCCKVAVKTNDLLLFTNPDDPSVFHLMFGASSSLTAKQNLAFTTVLRDLKDAFGGHVCDC